MVRERIEQTVRGIDRRQLLIGGGVGAGLLVAWAFWPRDYPVNLTPGKGEHVFNSFLKIGEDGHITVVLPQAEMGQGVFTVLAQILADELGADWRTIAIEPAPISPNYTNSVIAKSWTEGVGTQILGDVARFVHERTTREDAWQITGGSSSVRAFEPLLRKAGATAKVLLCMAAAHQWDADWRACDTLDGFVVRGEDKMRFGTLAALAATLSPPRDSPVRTGQEGRLRAQNLPRLDLPAKVDGSANYAADVRLPGMVYAAIAMGPLGRARLKSSDANAARTVKGVLDVIQEKSWIAVTASTWWAANSALEKARPVFATTGTVPDSHTAHKALLLALSEDSNRYVEAGDVNAVFANGKVWTSEYRVGFAPHAALEPMAATAVIRDGQLELWLPTQVPQLARRSAARAIGIREDNVIIHPMLVGGSFGRKYETEIAGQAAILAQKTGKPVQLVWSRAEDMRQDRFRPAAAARMFARIKPDGGIEAWRARIAAPATLKEMQARIIDGATPMDALADTAKSIDAETLTGSIPPYKIHNLSIRHHPVDLGVPTGKWRSGADSFTAFFTESFIDELAQTSGVEPYSYRMALLGSNPRLAYCLTRATALAAWQGGGPGTQQGLACHSMLGSHIALVAEAFVGDDQQVIVTRLTACVDVGQIIHPDILRQQIEGGLLFGLASAVGRPVRISEGVVEPARLGHLRLPTLAQCPEIHIELVSNREPYGGVGEIAVPPVAPAIANALHAATGKRFRTLPFLSGDWA